MRLRKPLAKILAMERVCRVATAGREGIPHVVPVCHVAVNGRLYFGTARDSVKARHLRANPNLAALVDLYAEEWSLLKGVMIQGSVRLIERGPLFRKVRALLYRKYPQYPAESALEERDSLVIEVIPRRVTSWGFEKG